MTIASYLFGVLTIVCGCGVVFCSKPLNSALFLVATLFLVAVHFALLSADFVAVIQVLVYAGAIMVLVIFVIMLLGPDAQGEGAEKKEYLGSGIAAVACGVFLAMIVHGIAGGGHFPTTEPVPGSEPEFRGTTQLVGWTMFRDYLYPFELISLLILAGIIGSVVLGYEPKRPLAAGRGLKATRKRFEEIPK